MAARRSRFTLGIAIAADNGLQIASLLDLAGTKASVVQMRAEAKHLPDIKGIIGRKQQDFGIEL
jgi:hypothetical protein